MYASYFYSAGATAANVLADIGALLTGTTDKATLSASCNQSSTSIDASVYTAAWTLHDASAGTNAKCYKREYPDDATKFAYLVVDTNTSGKVLMKVYETWNAGTHAGTNLCYYSDQTGGCPQVSLAAGGQIDIYCNNYCVLMVSLFGATYGSSSQLGWTGLFFRTRNSAWDTVANGYPPFAWVWSYASNAPYCYAPRTLSAAGADITGANAPMNLCTIFGQGLIAPSLTVPAAADKTLKHLLIPFFFSYYSTGNLGGDVSQNADVYITSASLGTNFDEFEIGSNRYVIWSSSLNYRIAVRKG